MSEQRNLILAIVLSAIVLLGWQYFIGGPRIEQERARQTELAEQQQQQQRQGPAAPSLPAGPTQRALARAEALARSPRTTVQTPTMEGSINLIGARFDDIRLRAYRETPDSDSPEIELLSPQETALPYFAELGWRAPQDTSLQLPGPQTQWIAVDGNTLAPGSNVTLRYEDGEGLIYTRRLSVDERYMITVTDRVENTGQAAVVLYPYASISRPNLPATQGNWIVHEGFIGVANGVLQDPGYAELAEENETRRFESTGGWAGITDKYWMTAIIPPQDEPVTSAFRAYDYNGAKAYEARYELAARTIAPGAAQEVTQRVFAGPKVVDIVEDYRDELGIPLFDYSVDWGWFFFLTKPIFLALDYLYRFAGNFGVAILLFTVFVKLLFFPLASSSFRAMSKMKKLQPEMERLRERFKEDKMQLQQAVMELYRREKVNPLAGCLPMLIQIPVFFSLYKVLFVSIEMRHAPFFGWIRDLSAADPTTVFNLFGLIPWNPAQVPFFGPFLMVGALPILMGLTMWLQMKLNPPPSDPAQARIFGLMPIIFTFMLGSFPVGLVIYWTWLNVLNIAQQVYIMKQTGTPVDVFERLGDVFRRTKRETPPDSTNGTPR